MKKETKFSWRICRQCEVTEEYQKEFQEIFDFDEKTIDPKAVFKSGPIEVDSSCHGGCSDDGKAVWAGHRGWRCSDGSDDDGPFVDARCEGCTKLLEHTLYINSRKRNEKLENL